MEISMECKGLTKEEREGIMNLIKKIQRKRRRDDRPRLNYKILLDKEIKA